MWDNGGRGGGSCGGRPRRTHAKEEPEQSSPRLEDWHNRLMPDFIPPEAARFELRDGNALVRLDVDPPPAMTAGQWSMVSRMTMCVLDGPGDTGYLLARLGPDGNDQAPHGWDEAVERDGGGVVVFGAGADAPSIFVPVLA